MPNEVRVPQMGESVTEATILRWLKQVGETVSAGDPIAELETDKVNVEVPADSAGVIQSFAHAEGDTGAGGGWGCAPRAGCGRRAGGGRNPGGCRNPCCGPQWRGRACRVSPRPRFGR